MLEKLGGKRGGQVVAAILNNFETVEKSLDTMMNSAGNAEKEMDVIRQSIEYKINAMKQTTVGIWQNLFQREDIGMLVDAFTSVLNVIDKVTEKLGLFGSVGVAGAVAGIALLVKNLNTIEPALKVFNIFNKLGKTSEGIQAAGAAMQGLSKETMLAVVSSQKLTAEQGKAVLIAAGLGDEEAETAAKTLGLASAQGTATGTTVTFGNAMKTLGSTIASVAKSLATFLFTTPEGILISLTAAAGAAVAIMAKLDVTFDEAAEAAREAGEEYDNEQQKLESIETELEAVREKIAAIEAGGPLSLTDEAELSRLKAQEASLQTQYELQQKITNLKGKQSAEAASEALDNEGFAVQDGFETTYVDGVPMNTPKLKGVNILDKIKDEQDTLEEIKSQRALVEAELKELAESDEYDKYGLNAKGESLFDSKEYKRLQKQLDSLDMQEDSVSTSMAEHLADTQELYSQLYNANGEIITGYEDVAAACDDVFEYVLTETERAAEKEQAIADILNGDEFDGLKERIENASPTSEEDIEKIIQDTDGLKEALDEAGVSATDFATYCLNGFQDVGDAALDVANDISQIDTTFEDAKEACGNLHSEIEAVQSVITSQSTGNSISIEDFEDEELQDYTAALEYNNGALQLNKEKVSELIEAKTQEQLAINKTNKALKQAEYVDNAREIEQLRKKIREHNYAEGESQEAIQGTIDALLAENEAIRDECTGYDLINSKLREATDSYHNWLNAQNATESGDMFDDTVAAMQHIEDTLNNTDSDMFGRVGRVDYKAAVDLIIPDTVDPKDEAAIDDYMRSIYDMFTYDENGNRAGLNIENFCQKAVDAGLMVLDDATDEYRIAGEKTMEEFAEGLNLSIPMVQAMFGEMEEFGGEFDWKPERTLGDLAVAADVAAEKLRALNQDLVINLDYSKLETTQDKVNYLATTMQQMKDYRATLDVDSSEFEYANDVIAYCVAQIQELNKPVIMDVDVSKVSEVSEEAGEAVALLQEFKNEYNNLDTQKQLGLDTTEAENKLNGLLTEIQNSDNSYVISLGLDDTSINSLNQSLDELGVQTIEAKLHIDDTALVTFQEQDKSEEIPTKVSVDDSEYQEFHAKDKDEKATVKYNVDHTAVDNFNPPNLTRTITYNVETNGSAPSTNTSSSKTSSSSKSSTSKSSGKSNSSSTKNSANRNGTSKAAGGYIEVSGKTLVGELGREMYVNPNTGKWYTVGDHGAEFVYLPQGSIVYNHEETEKLLREGNVASSALSRLSGPSKAYSRDKDRLSGSGSTTGKKEKVETEEVVVEVTTKKSTGTGGSVSGGIKRKHAVASGSSGGNSTGNYVPPDETVETMTDEEFSDFMDAFGENNPFEQFSEQMQDMAEEQEEPPEPEKIDWIEVAIDRIERAIDSLKTTADSAYKTLKTRLTATYDEMSAVNKELEIQQAAYSRYMQEANSVGLSPDLAALVQKGAIDINLYDPETAEQIKEYQEWYEKALDCKDAIQQLHEELASLYEDNFKKVQTDFDNQLALLEHLTNTYETGLDGIEKSGYLASTDYYKALQDVERSNIAVMQKELADLTKYYSEAMNSGEIEEGSEAWYSMQTSINDVKEALQEATVQLQDYENSMRELEWSYFDYIQDRIGQLTQESDFLIDLLSGSDLYLDSGQLSDEGLATVGLHAQNYDVYMAQADQYAEEIKNINKELANDPNNTKLIERREELLKLQQDSILAAEDEKQAIVDMVEEGIQIELDNLKELIDLYKDSLDNAKDLYEYQKSIEEKSENISNLQKQLSAYENDTSEETRAKVQQLKVDLSEAQEDLQETEYDKFISDYKKLLDSLYTEYELVLNERLDNIDALLADMIDMVNANATTLNDSMFWNTSSIVETLDRVSGEVGYTMSENMWNVWHSAGALGDVVSMYDEGFLQQMTSINSVLGSIQVNTQQMIEASNQIAQALIQSAQATTQAIEGMKAQTDSSKYDDVGSAQSGNQYTGGGFGGWGDLSDMFGSGSGSDSGSSSGSGSGSTGSSGGYGSGTINAGGAYIYDYIGASPERQYYANDPIYTILQEKNGWLQVRWHGLSSGVTGWFKASDVTRYKTGGLVDYTGLAQLDGTPSNPELVLNAKDTKNFIQLKNILEVLSKQGYGLGGSSHGVGETSLSGINSSASSMIPGLSNRTFNSSSSAGDINIDINIDKVEDYNDFVNKMQKDRQFEKMIRSMTTDRLAGGSSLAKNKYSWSDAS